MCQALARVTGVSRQRIKPAFGGLFPTLPTDVASFALFHRADEVALRPNCDDAVLRIKDRLSKLKGFPADFGGLDEMLPSRRYVASGRLLPSPKKARQPRLTGSRLCPGLTRPMNYIRNPFRAD